MRTEAQSAFQVRKTPVQARSAVTVDAISEAAIQVLLTHGSERLTTTRVADRAGVSVGTLYQYYPNKQSVLFAVLEKHLDHLSDAVVQSCELHHGQPLASMVEAIVTAFVDAKMERPDVSMALYSVAAELDGSAVVSKITKRGRAAIASMLASTPDVYFDQVHFTALMMMSAMAGTTRAVLEAGAQPKMIRMLRRELVLMCHGYLRSAATRLVGPA